MSPSRFVYNIFFLKKCLIESFHACGRDKMSFAKIFDAMRIELILTLDDKMSAEI